MKFLFKFSVPLLLLALITSNAMAVDGINSTGNNALPIGAGGNTILKVSPTGLTEFFHPTTGAQTAWIKAEDGSASFSSFLNVKTAGNVEAGKLIVTSPVGSQGALSTVNVNGNQVWTNSGNLYFNYTTSGDSIVHFGRPSKTTSIYIPQGFLQIGTQAADAETILIANTFKSCAANHTVVSDGNGGYSCQEVVIIPPSCPATAVTISCKRSNGPGHGCGTVSETINVPSTPVNQSFTQSTNNGSSCKLGYSVTANCLPSKTWDLAGWDCDAGTSNSNNAGVTEKRFLGFGLNLYIP